MANKEEIMATVAQAKQMVKQTQVTTVWDFFEQKRDLIAKALPNTITTDRLIGVLTMLMKSSPQLMECSQASLIGAVIQTVQLGLTPSNIGHCHYVPFNNKKKDGSFQKEVQFIIGYRGMIELVNRSGKAVILSAECVYDKDQFQQEQGLNPVLRHVPAVGDRGSFAGVYCIAKNMVAQEKVFIYLQKEEIEKVRNASKAGQSEYSPWSKWYDEMAKKTAVKRICKLLPLSIDVQRQLSADETIKPVIDKDMVDLPDKTNWDAQDAEVVQEQPQNPPPASTGHATPNEPEPDDHSDASEEERPVKAVLSQIPIGGSVLEFKGLINGVATRKTKTGKDITAYSVEDSDGTAYVIEKWGTPHKGAEEGVLASFIDVSVSEFNNQRKYMCKSIGLEA
jgi:recombination protein RecT